MKKQMLTENIDLAIFLSIIWLFGLRGFSFITLGSAGNEDRAMAANVSIIRFTQSICVTVSGDSIPMNDPKSTTRQAHTLIVIWKRMNLLIFR